VVENVLQVRWFVIQTLKGHFSQAVWLANSEQSVQL